MSRPLVVLVATATVLTTATVALMVSPEFTGSTPITGPANVDAPAVRDATTPTTAANLLPVTDQLLDLVNVARQTAGLYPLTVNPKITLAAETHSLDMARTMGNPISHVGSDGSTLADRLEDAGYDAAASAENIASGQLDAVLVFAAFVASPEHYANLLNSICTEIGFAAARGANNALYWTMDFGLPAE